ncbi:MAG: MBOAT family O-acyltransferase [Chloroflexota bacterium]
MALDLPTILLLGGAALVYAAVLPSSWRPWALLVGSVLAVYWLQPPLPLRYSGYVLPTATLTLTVLTWYATRPSSEGTTRQDTYTLIMIVFLVAGMSLMRFVPAGYRLTSTQTPHPFSVLLALLPIALMVWAVGRLPQRLALTLLVFLIAGLFVTLKAEPLATDLSRGWRGLAGQDITLAGVADLGWLGFSYVAFRLLHTVRDRQTGLLPNLSLREYVTYVIFFPALTAGPIERAERFAENFRQLPDQSRLDAGRFTAGWTRILIGLFKKFILADLLAQGLSLNAANASQVQAAGWLWLLLYGYGLRLYFDFGGYTDVAIGLGTLFGIELPENFKRPYLRPNITAFWQSWHITLSNWARFYVFTPLSRALLRRRPAPSPTLVVLLAHLATMTVIGLWHGVTVNFLVWGLWHGLALFVHKQWSDRTRRWYHRLQERPRLRRAWAVTGWLLTFHYVLLGWVWFALPTPDLAGQTLFQLMGVE